MLKGNKADFMIIDDAEQTPHEERKQLRLKRKADVKDRDLERRQKRQDKRRQFY